jgi:hypothetical protein
VGDLSGMTAGHFLFIPAVLLVGMVLGWILGSRAARDAFAAELKRRDAKAQRRAASARVPADAPGSPEAQPR